jgi:hypothetical protein
MKDKKTKIKYCCGKCPKCGAGEMDIDWSSMTADEFPTQNATCKKCGCEFTEVYRYAHTVIEE